MVSLCLEYRYYRLRDVLLLDSDCDDIDAVQLGTNATYTCTALNITERTYHRDGDNMKFCEQLVTVECMRRIPIDVKGCDNEDDDERGCAGSSDSGNSGGRGDDDDSGGTEDDLVLCLLMDSTERTSSCNFFVDVTMSDPGR